MSGGWAVYRATDFQRALELYIGEMVLPGHVPTRNDFISIFDDYIVQLRNYAALFRRIKTSQNVRESRRTSSCIAVVGECYVTDIVPTEAQTQEIQEYSMLPIRDFCLRQNPPWSSRVLFYQTDQNGRNVLLISLMVLLPQM
jgi:hypothetical protein